MKLKSCIGSCLLLILTYSCQNSKNAGNSNALKWYTGILQKVGMCGQRVISNTSSNRSGLSNAPVWTDSSSGKTYENVFTVDNFCNFPSRLKEEAVVNFTITDTIRTQCIACQTYTPVPKEKNNITVGCKGSGSN